jgi:hypothetical protein
MNKYFIYCFLIGSLFCINVPAKDQPDSKDQNSEQQKKGGNGGDSGQDGDELFLDEIEIKGKVEKPSVIIMPKRIDPEVGEVHLEREFEQELKEGMGEIPQVEDETNRVEDVQSIKRALNRDRE